VDTGSALVEANINTVLQNLYEANGAPSGEYCFIGGTGARRDFTEFARDSGSTGDSYQLTESASQKKLTFTVTLYEGDYGIVKVLPASLFVDRTSGSATLESDTALLVDSNAYSLFSLKAEASTELEDQGGGRRGFCEMICALGMESPKSHGFFYT